MTSVMKPQSAYEAHQLGAQDGFVKVYWTNGTEKTAGLIFTRKQMSELSITELSRRWPYFEAPKMKKLVISSVYSTFAAALES